MIKIYKLNNEPISQKNIFDYIGKIMIDNGITNKKYIKSMKKREKIVSVYMGNYLAIPHGIDGSDAMIDNSGLVFISFPKPMNWSGNLVHFVIGIAVKRSEQMKLLQKIAVKFMDEDEVLKLKDKTAQEQQNFFESL